MEAGEAITLPYRDGVGCCHMHMLTRPHGWGLHKRRQAVEYPVARETQDLQTFLEVTGL